MEAIIIGIIMGTGFIIRSIYVNLYYEKVEGTVTEGGSHSYNMCIYEYQGVKYNSAAHTLFPKRVGKKEKIWVCRNNGKTAAEIVYNQADYTKENHIIRLDTKEQLRSAYPMIVQQTHKSSNPANALKTMELIDRLMEAVPIYPLSCNMERSAAKVVYEGMQRHIVNENE